MAVLKTTIYLPEELKRSLSHLAQQTGTSEAELIRQAVREKVARSVRPRPRVPLNGRSLGDPTAAERVDDLLVGFGQR